MFNHESNNQPHVDNAIKLQNNDAKSTRIDNGVASMDYNQTCTAQQPGVNNLQSQSDNANTAQQPKVNVPQSQSDIFMETLRRRRTTHWEHEVQEQNLESTINTNIYNESGRQWAFERKDGSERTPSRYNRSHVPFRNRDVNTIRSGEWSDEEMQQIKFEALEEMRRDNDRLQQALQNIRHTPKSSNGSSTLHESAKDVCVSGCFSNLVRYYDLFGISIMKTNGNEIILYDRRTSDKKENLQKREEENPNDLQLLIDKMFEDDSESFVRFRQSWAEFLANKLVFEDRKRRQTLDDNYDDTIWKQYALFNFMGPNDEVVWRKFLKSLLKCIRERLLFATNIIIARKNCMTKNQVQYQKAMDYMKGRVVALLTYIALYNDAKRWRTMYDMALDYYDRIYRYINVTQDKNPFRDLSDKVQDVTSKLETKLRETHFIIEGNQKQVQDCIDIIKDVDWIREISVVLQNVLNI
jgi:hypothetical protein